MKLNGTATPWIVATVILALMVVGIGGWIIGRNNVNSVDAVIVPKPSSTQPASVPQATQQSPAPGLQGAGNQVPMQQPEPPPVADETASIRAAAQEVIDYLRSHMEGVPSGPADISVNYTGGNTAQVRATWPITFRNEPSVYRYLIKLSKYGDVWKEDSTSPF